MRVLFLSVAVACTAVRPAAAQAEASVGLGVSTVRYAGNSSTSPSVSPTLQYSSPGVFLGLSGTAATISQGEWSSQGRGNLWLATPPILGNLRLAGDGTVAGTTHTGGPWTAAAHGVGELVWSAPKWGFGVGAGPSAGWIQDQPSVTVLHSRARAWWRLAGSDWGVSVEPTRFLGAWFTDATMGFTVDRGPVAFSAWGLARFSQVYGSKAAGSAFLKFFPTPFLAIEIGGGSYLPDPYQGLPRASYVSAGLRFHAFRRVPRATPALQSSPLIPSRRGDSLVVLFRMPGADSVAVAGDWNGWQPIALQRTAAGEWEGVIALAPGLYHFVLLVDGKDWVVPGGVTTVKDGMDGLEALLLVE